MLREYICLLVCLQANKHQSVQRPPRLNKWQINKPPTQQRVKQASKQTTPTTTTYPPHSDHWWPGAGIMEADDRQVTTVITVQPSFHHRHSTNWVSWSFSIVGERAVTPHLADDANASWYSVCRVPMVEWRLDCENCRHLTVVGLHDTDPRSGQKNGIEIVMM